MAAEDDQWRGGFASRAGEDEEVESPKEEGESERAVSRPAAASSRDYLVSPSDYRHNRSKQADNRSDGRDIGASNYLQAYENYPHHPPQPQWGSTARFREAAAPDHTMYGGSAMMMMDQEEHLFSAGARSDLFSGSSRLLLHEQLRSPFLYEPAWSSFSTPQLDQGYDKSSVFTPALPDLDLPGFETDQHLHMLAGSGAAQAPPHSHDELAARFPPPAHPPARQHALRSASSSSSSPSHAARDHDHHHLAAAAARGSSDVIEDDESMSSSDSDDQAGLFDQIMTNDGDNQAAGSSRAAAPGDAAHFPSFAAAAAASADDRSQLSYPDSTEDKAATAAELEGPDHQKASTKKPAAAKPRKKGQKRVREPRVALVTKSEVEHLEDGYRWRKYGQKAVKNSPHPRSYYRCTNSKCFVKKRVERCVEDPSLVVTTYEGQHTHHSPAVLRGRAMMDQSSNLGSSMQLPPGTISPAAAMSLLLSNTDPLANSPLNSNPHLNTSTASLLQPFFHPRPANFGQTHQVRQRSAPPFPDNYNLPFQTLTSPLFNPNPVNANPINPNLINPNSSLIRPPPVDKGLLDDMLPPSSRKPPPPSSS